MKQRGDSGIDLTMAVTLNIGGGTGDVWRHLEYMVRVLKGVEDGEIQPADIHTRTGVTREHAQGIMERLSELTQRRLDLDFPGVAAQEPPEVPSPATPQPPPADDVSPSAVEGPWHDVVVVEICRVLEAADREYGSNIQHACSSLTKLLLLGCAEAGLSFVAPHTASFRQSFFKPAHERGWLPPAKWLNGGSTTRPFNNLRAPHTGEVIRQRCAGSSSIGGVHAFGLTEAARERFWQDLVDAGIPATALERMRAALRGARLVPNDYPAALLEAPDEVLRRGGDQ